MGLGLINTLLFILMNVSIGGNYLQQGFDRARYYDAMASGKIEIVNEQLDDLEKGSLQNKEAFIGSMQMKKAGLLTKAKDKLDLFKSGRKKLEAGIKKDPDNGELRFLRLMIQEQAPKIVNYRSELTSDSMFIDKSFKSLSPSVQQAIRSYSKKSKLLHSKDF